MAFDSRATRYKLLKLLRKGHALTQAEITERLPIDSKRQVRRHLQTLREQGIEIEEQRRGREKVFYLPPEALEVDGPSVSLTEKQALSLVIAAEAGRAALAPTPFAEPLEAGFNRLLDRLDRASGTYDLGQLREQWHFGTEPAASTFNGEVFDTLVEALNQRRPVRIDYEPAHVSDAPRTRTVSPLVMAAPGGSWRCVSYCHYREAPRDFTLSRIEGITILTDEVAIRPDDFDPDLYFHERFGALGGETRVVRLMVEPDAARYFREKSYHPSQIVEEIRDDGRLVVSFEVEGLEDMTSWVQSWGASVKVLDPPVLAERIAEEACKVAARYGDAPECDPTPDANRPDG
jgi:predicted DNA-binding transcriptional regulator YafY